MQPRWPAWQMALVAHLLLLAIFLLLLSGCGVARRGEPLGKPVELRNQSEARGQVLFMRHCNQCHPGGETGLGPALNNKPLPGFGIHTQIRNGFGAMPAFSGRVLSDQDVSDIIAYVHALRRARNRVAAR